jgi:polysaccharide export outer membrane protein
MQPDYVLQPFDMIQIVVFQEPDLERQVRLSQESSVTLPLIGAVNLRDKTIREAQNLIRDLYDRDYLVNPQINITVTEYSKVTVNVLGSVDKPGAVPIQPDRPLNLIDAITQAGGFTRLADRKRIKLTRQTADGKTTTTVINADEIIQSTSEDQWILQKGDVLYVPERLL